MARGGGQALPQRADGSVPQRRQRLRCAASAGRARAGGPACTPESRTPDGGATTARRSTCRCGVREGSERRLLAPLVALADDAAVPRARAPTLKGFPEPVDVLAVDVATAGAAAVGGGAADAAGHRHGGLTEMLARMGDEPAEALRRRHFDSLRAALFSAQRRRAALDGRRPAGGVPPARGRARLRARAMRDAVRRGGARGAAVAGADRAGRGRRRTRKREARRAPQALCDAAGPDEVRSSPRVCELVGTPRRLVFGEAADGPHARDPAARRPPRRAAAGCRSCYGGGAVWPRRRRSPLGTTGGGEPRAAAARPPGLPAARRRGRARSASGSPTTRPVPRRSLETGLPSGSRTSPAASTPATAGGRAGDASFGENTAGTDLAAGLVPVISYENLAESAPARPAPDFERATMRNLREPATMAAWLPTSPSSCASWRPRGDLELPVVLQVEGNLWGFAQLAADGDDATTVPVEVEGSGSPAARAFPTTCRPCAGLRAPARPPGAAGAPGPWTLSEWEA